MAAFTLEAREVVIDGESSMRMFTCLRIHHLYFIFLIGLLFVYAPLTSATQVANEQAPGRIMARQATQTKELWITANHAKFKELQGPFKTGPEVTKACLYCHSEAETQFHKTIHWNWIAQGTGNQTGKAGYSINNFCISTNKGEDKSCLACHPGWGTATEAINCLVCHGQKNINWEESFADMQYFAESEDKEDKELADELQAEIQTAVQSVGRPTRKNCGSCHFYGGGGDGVKHGDLDSSLAEPNKALDVHMGVDGQNFDCTRCHTTTLHRIAGRIYTAPAAIHRKSLVEDDLIAKITCESCHSSKPHKTDHKANDHTDKVACQSCHIPEFARVNPTKMWWDWSKAGKKKDGKPYRTKGPLGKHVYMSIKGEMKWATNVKPEYFWFDGSIKSVNAKDVIDPDGVVAVSWPAGNRDDKNARIFPFKVHRGMQPYDKVNRTLLAPLLSVEHGYWKTLDWNGALAKGQEALGLPYSGDFDFVETTYVFPTTHMVAPKDNVVACNECHIRKEGRLANLVGFYMPGRDHNSWINIIGWITVFGSFAGVTLHGLGRIFSNGTNAKKKEDKKWPPTMR